MINGFVNLISKPGFQNLVQNTTAQVSIETGLKAAGRPAFTLADKNVDKQTRKYAAVKELLYQSLCLGIYLAVIPITFKKGGFKLFKKICAKADKYPEVLKELTKGKIDKCSIDMFKNEKGLLALYKLSHLEKAERFDKTNKAAVKLLKQLKDNLVEGAKGADEVLNSVQNLEKNDDYFKRFFIAKGGMEMSSIVGSVVGLTLLAPELSHLILHPIMKALNMEAPKAKDVNLKEKPAAKPEPVKVDTKA